MKHCLLDLNLARIWEELFKKYNNNPLELRKYDDFYNFIKVLFLKHDHKPFLSKEMVEADQSLEGYYNNHKEQLKIKTDYLIDFFEYAGDFYDMRIPCIVKKNLLSKEEYSNVFALAVDNYKNEELPYFLTYQFQHSLQELDSYNSFLLEVSDLLSNKDSKIAINIWIEYSKYLFRSENKMVGKINNDQEIHSNNITDLPGQQRNLNADEELDFDSGTKKSEEKGTCSNGQNQHNILVAEEQENKDNADHEESDRLYIPGFQIENMGDLTNQEIEYFFSFLYKKVGVEEPFLAKDQVAIILENGIKLPDTPLENKFKFKTSLRKPRRLADYFFHKFYILYNHRNKRKFLQFLGAYIEDYSKALDPKGLENLRKNFSGKEPDSMVLKIEEFLPERYFKRPIPLRKQIEN